MECEKIQCLLTFRGKKNIQKKKIIIKIINKVLKIKIDRELKCFFNKKFVFCTF